MDDNVQDKVIAFDTLFTNNHIQMLKILMPYFDLSMQKNMAVYIKYQELMYTMEFFRKYPDAKASPLPKENSFNIAKLCGEIIPYCEPRDRGRLENMRNMFRQFQTYKDMMETIQMMKDLFPEGENPMNSEFVSNMTGMGGGFDMSQMAGLFQAMSGGSGDSGSSESSGGSKGSGGFDMSQMAGLFQAMSDISVGPDTSAASEPAESHTDDGSSREAAGGSAEKGAHTENDGRTDNTTAPGDYVRTSNPAKAEACSTNNAYSTGAEARESQKSHADENKKRSDGNQQQNNFNTAQIIDMFKAMSGHNNRSETGGNANGSTQ